MQEIRIMLVEAINKARPEGRLLATEGRSGFDERSSMIRI